MTGASRGASPGGGTGRAAARTGADACPGTLRPHAALDGSLVRLRLPGGGVDPAVLERLMRLAGAHGSPLLQLTSRANLQVRGLPDPLPQAFVEEVAALGLLPSATHERARNVLAVPDPAAQALARRLDTAVRAEPALAGLPGRFLTIITDRTGVLLGERWDLALQLVGAGPPDRTDVRVLVAPDQAVRRPQPADRAVATVVDLMRAFLRLRPDERTWNVRDLPDPGALHPDLVPQALRPAPPLRPGDRPDAGRLVAGVPLGLLRPQHTAALLRVADDGKRVVLTPWRSVVVNLAGGGVADATTDDGVDDASPAALDAAARTLERAGMVVRPGSPWARLSACVGAPHCGRTTSPTLTLTLEAAARVTEAGPRVHVVGCGRACGRPPGDHVLVLKPTHPGQIVQEAR